MSSESGVKIIRHTQAPLKHLKTLTERFSVVHIDFISERPVPPSEDFKCSLTMVHVKQLCPVSESHHGVPSCFVHPELANCPHCFLRVDAARPALTQPYTGPQQVLERDAKTLILEENGKQSFPSQLQQRLDSSVWPHDDFPLSQQLMQRNNLTRHRSNLSRHLSNLRCNLHNQTSNQH
ncbi:Hypothetical predicted protein [Cloeon dipterum]|uniref:Uncharacterized protein n=1 Tax=Cloeon dipterum TaxID=197152 RepID=A0A8S1D5F5_9INSE|nr:Hypothetical predicted protein [Cloeon dipterum]